ncbi:MAG TPA: hypothetical protein VK826_19205 [Bacteroidia bacterium]|nr:hypothetical protein [Bacteroidia bacterium]
MRKALLILSLIFTGVLSAQIRCEVWQYLGTDSANKTLAKTEIYNERGLLISETFTHCRYGSSIETDGIWTFQYTDTLLISRTFAATDGDSMRHFFQYDSSGKLIHDSYYQRRFVQSDTVPSGVFTFTRVVTDTNEGKWEHFSEGIYTYDRWGRKVACTSKSERRGTEMKETRVYDKKGRILSQEVFVGGIRYKNVEYTHFKGGYSYLVTLYDDNGTMKHTLPPDSLGYWPRLKTTCKLDKKGRIIEVFNTEEDKRQREKTVTHHDAEGRVARKVYYDEQNRLSTTHIYTYN